jgi:acid phosphatase type 7
MRITWITNDTNVPSIVEYGTSPGVYNSSAKGENTSYTYLGYRSGQIHYVTLGPLEASTIYYYRCGTYGPEYSVKTPRSQFPITFAIVGKTFSPFHLPSVICVYTNSNMLEILERTRCVWR